MRYWYDKEFKGVICEPNSADEWMELIQDISWHYDGCNTVESLKGLIDEIVEMTAAARVCLEEGKIFEDKEGSFESLLAARSEQEKDMEG